MQAKKRVVKDYDKLPEDVINKLKLEYPRGFVKHLVKYTNKDGLQVSALPYETEDMYYLIRMSATEARQIILDDDDYEDGVLRENFGMDDFDGDVKEDVELDDDDNEPSYDDPMDDMDEDMDDEDED
jgi:DNA-directed RNA polymerase subunit delta